MSLSGASIVGACVCAIAWMAIRASRRPALGLQILLLVLPILDLSVKAFTEESRPFPSIETIAGMALATAVLANGYRNLGHVQKLGQLVMLLLLVFAVTAICSSVISSQPVRSLKIVLSGVIVPSICFCIASFASGLDERERILRGLLGMATICGVYTLLNLFRRVGSPEFSMHQGFAWVYSDAPIVNFFQVPSAGAAATLPILPVAYWYLRNGRGRGRTILSLTAIASVLTISILSFSRGAWLGGALVFVSSAIALVHGRARVIYATAAVFACVLWLSFGAWDVVQPIVQVRLGDTSDLGEPNVSIRAENYRLAVESARVHLLSGVGLGNYPEIYDDFPESPAAQLPPLWFAHNLFLTLIPEVGLLGASAFAIISCVLICAGIVQRGHRSSRDLGRSLAIGLGGLLFVASTSGCHLIAALAETQQSTYFCSPVMIVAFTLFGLLASGANDRSHRQMLQHIGPAPVAT